jgi:hypothetical protein
VTACWILLEICEVSSPETYVVSNERNVDVPVNAYACREKMISCGCLETCEAIATSYACREMVTSCL